MINTVSITGLKQNTAGVIKKIQADGKSMIIMQRSEPAAVIVDTKYYEILEEALEDKMDLKTIAVRIKEPRVSSKIVAKKLGLRA